MPLSADEPPCPKFQPNIFDPARCHDCLRQRHLHASAGESTEEAPRLKPTAGTGTGGLTDTGTWTGGLKDTGTRTGGLKDTGTWTGAGKGVLLTPIQSQAEEKDTSSKEDSDGFSVVSSYCDVSGVRPGPGESSLCILSPECELYICDGDDDDSTDSYQEFSGSVSAEDEYLPIRRRPAKPAMTRLDPPPHRPSPRAWMDEARSREGFTRRAGMSDDREKRESGYFSLGRATGARSLRDSSPSAPFRHFERGHPLFSARNIEPKDTIPFRNPNLGVASERQVPEDEYDDLPLGIHPPDPYDIAIEVEAQVGPRSPSPTPFKVAESLASDRKGFSSSYGRGSPASHVSSFQSGRFDSSRRSSALPSRSSSPSRGNLPFRRSESTGSLSRRSPDGGGRSQGMEPRSQSSIRSVVGRHVHEEPGSRSSLQSTQARRGESGTLPRNFKSLPGSVKYQTSTVSDFRSALKRTEVNGSLSSRGPDGRSSSPSRRDLKPPGPMSLRKTETTSRSPARRDSRTSSPSRRTSEARRDSSSPPRRNYSSSTRSLLFKSESVTSLNGRGHNGRCGSPVREGYDIESQALLRNSTARNRLSDQEHEHESPPAVSPPRRGHDTPTQSILRKTESSPVPGSRGRDSRASSPGRRGHETPRQFPLRKTDPGGSLSGRGRESRNQSPARRSYEAPSQSLLRKSEGTSSVRGRDAHSVSPSRKRHDVSEQHSLRKTQTSSSLKHSSLSSSPSGRGSSDPPGYSVLRCATNGDSSRSLQRKNTHTDSRSDSKHSPRSWRESTTHSPRSSSLSRGASPSRPTTNGSRAAFVTLEEEPRSPSSFRSVVGRHVHEERSLSPGDKRSSHRGRSPSPAPHIQMRRHTSSQSSMESSESGPLLAGSTGRNREEYAMLADLPKVKRIHEREETGHIGNQPVTRRQELFKPASHSLSKHPSREWDDAVDTDRDWHYAGSGHLSRAHSSTSLQRSGSPTADEGGSWRGSHPHRSEHMQPDLLNFKKGWMSKLDDSGEWKKHWFVLTDAGLKYYRDASAEEKDDMDGEIDLKSCVKVSEFDVEKNYGFQIQTREAVVTLSAMTAGIRRNWIEVLKKCIRPSSSPDLTQLPDSSSDKENSHSRFLVSSRRPSSRHANDQLDVPSSAPQRRFDYVELSPVPASSSPLPASQREAGEGQGRESQWQEERNTSSQWEAVLSRKGTGVGSNQRLRMEDDIERKWAEFERLPLKEMSALPPMGSRLSGQSANEALQREVASLRQQLEQLQRGGRGGGGGGGGGVGGDVRGGCGPDAPCGRSLAAMERAHRQALEELQRQHDRQIKELETEKEKLLLEGNQDTARVMEALKKKHKEELDREVERVKRLGSGVFDSQTLRAHQQAETQSLQRELAGLSERYSQKCLELNRAEQSSAEREREISRKERDMEQLRKENLDLKARLTEEMSRVRSTIKDPDRSKDNKDGTSCELEVLLRVKENEINYLQKEISCLRNELQFLNTEKRLACERYTEVHEELSGMKGRSEREIQSLKEHLRLAMAALQEGQKLGNSLDH